MTAPRADWLFCEDSSSHAAIKSAVGVERSRRTARALPMAGASAVERVASISAASHRANTSPEHSTADNLADALQWASLAAHHHLHDRLSLHR